MRQHVINLFESAPRSANPLRFWDSVVTRELTLCQEYEQIKRYLFVTRLLQTCANVKSVAGRESERDFQGKCTMTPFNMFIFSCLQGHSPCIFQGVVENSQAPLDQGFAVSTTFSTEDGALGRKKKTAQRWPQVTKNTGFPRSYSRVSTPTGGRLLRSPAGLEGAGWGA